MGFVMRISSHHLINNNADLKRVFVCDDFVVCTLYYYIIDTFVYWGISRLSHHINTF